MRVVEALRGCWAPLSFGFSLGSLRRPESRVSTAIDLQLRMALSRYVRLYLIMCPRTCYSYNTRTFCFDMFPTTGYSRSTEQSTYRYRSACGSFLWFILQASPASRVLSEFCCRPSTTCDIGSLRTSLPRPCVLRSVSTWFTLRAHAAQQYRAVYVQVSYECLWFFRLVSLSGVFGIPSPEWVLL